MSAATASSSELCGRELLGHSVASAQAASVGYGPVELGEVPHAPEGDPRQRAQPLVEEAVGEAHRGEVGILGERALEADAAQQMEQVGERVVGTLGKSRVRGSRLGRRGRPRRRPRAACWRTGRTSPRTSARGIRAHPAERSVAVDLRVHAGRAARRGTRP